MRASISNITLAILAGGESSRMGRPKAELKIAGRYLLEHLLHQLAWPGPTILVTSPGRERPPGHERFAQLAVDPIAGLGPLRGLMTAIQHAPTELTAVLTVDMPHVTADQLCPLAEIAAKDQEAIGVMWGREVHKIEPFPSLWTSAARPVIEFELASGRRSVYTMASHPSVRLLAAPAWPAGVWSNLNTPADAAAANATF